MKKTFLHLLLIVLLGGLIYVSIFPKQEIEFKPESEGLEEWNKLRFADPKTGEIAADLRISEYEFIKKQFLSSTAKSSSFIDLQVTNRGPWNVGGRSRAIGMDLDNPSIILAGASNGGLWRSADGGGSWTKVSQSDGPTQSVTAIIQDPREGFRNRWVYGTGELSFFQGAGIYQSLDNGLTWDLVENTLNVPNEPFANTHKLAIDQDGTLWVASSKGIYALIEGSTDWETVFSGQSEGFYSVTVDINNVKYVAVRNDDIYRSEDGSNWEALNFPETVFSRLNLEASKEENPTLYYTATQNIDENGNPLLLWAYKDGIWTELTDNMNGELLPYPLVAWSTALQIHPIFPENIFLGNVDLIRSKDAFTSNDKIRILSKFLPDSLFIRGTEVIGDLLHVDHHDLFFEPGNETKALSVNDGGIYMTEDILGEDTMIWYSLNNGYLTTEFYAIAIDEYSPVFDPSLVMGGTQDNGSWISTSLDPEADWTNVGPGDGGYCFIPADPSFLYVSSQFGTILRIDLSDSLGTSIKPSFVGFGSLFIIPFEMDPFNNDRLYFPDQNTIYWNDGPSATTENWKKISNSTTPGNSIISTLNVSKATPDWLFYGITQGRIFKLFQPDQDQSPRIEITPFDSTNNRPAIGYVSNIATNPDDANELLATYSSTNVHSLYHSLDQGASWQAVGGNLEEFPDGTGNGPRGTWAHIIPNYTDQNLTLYLFGTSAGLYATTSLDGQATKWELISPELIGTTEISMIRSRNDAGFIAVGTKSSGIFQVDYPAGQFTTNTNEVPIAKEVSIFPNPARDFVQLRGDLVGSDYAEMRLVNLQGQVLFRRRISSPIDERIDLSAYSEGSYFIQVAAENRTTLSRSFIISR
ncbi:MAG: T9SS type A sorting domain-containing protein [Bacteroidota bacterium]